MEKGQSFPSRGVNRRLLLLGALVALAGCASARPVVVEPGGGVVAIPANRDAHRAKAEEIIRRNCPGGYDIVREEEAPVGSRVRGEKTTSRDIFDDITTKEEYTVRTKYEWRIHYRCR